MTSLLCITDQGYRAAVEEQDDTVVWMAHMLQRSEDTSVTLLLRRSAVNYASRSQIPAPVSFGDWTQAHPADFPRDLQRFADDGGRVAVLASDLERYGIDAGEVIDGIETVDDEGVAALCADHDVLSFW